MKLYFVTANPIVYKDDQGKLIDVTKDAVEAGLGRKIDGKSKNQLQVFATEAEAIEWAKYGVDAAAAAQHAILTLNTDLTEEDLKKAKALDTAKVEVEGQEPKIIPSFAIAADKFTIVKASFAYADKDAKDVIYNEELAKADQADKTDAPVSKTSAVFNTFKKWAVPLLTIGGAAGAFWYSPGAVNGALGLLAKVGLTLPAASMAVQVGVSLAVGLAVYGAFLASKAAFNGLSNAYKNWKRTNKEKYADDLSAETKAINELEAKAEYKADSSFVVALKDMLEKAPEPTFGDDGKFAKDEPKAGNRLALAQWEHAQLNRLVAAKAEDRKAIETEIRQGPKPTPSK
ncbi:MAG: hypothetical protein AB7I18_08795 [Candidatus Berkiella sp.]